MMDTPLLFCRLCNTPNHDGLDECAVCGTSIMTRQYVVTLTMEVPVEEYGVQEAIVRALSEIRLNPDDFLSAVEVETGE